MIKNSLNTFDKSPCLLSLWQVSVVQKFPFSKIIIFLSRYKTALEYFWHGTFFPAQETIRKKQAEAAEKRIAEQQQRGIKDIESVKRQQRRALELEKREQEAAASGTQPTLRVRIWAIAFKYVFG